MFCINTDLCVILTIKCDKVYINNPSALKSAIINFEIGLHSCLAFNNLMTSFEVHNDSFALVSFDNIFCHDWHHFKYN